MIVVGMTGAAGAGKDTVADRLVEQYGFEKRAFAGPLKRVLLAQNPIIGNDPYTGRPVYLGDAIARYTEAGVKLVFPEYRRLMQRLGTEGIRAISPDFWINAVLNEGFEETGKYVFTDVRFPNEAAAVRTLGGVLCHVERDALPSPVIAHSSENLAGRMDEEYTVVNNGTLKQLRRAVDDMAFELLDTPLLVSA